MRPSPQKQNPMAAYPAVLLLLCMLALLLTPTASAARLSAAGETSTRERTRVRLDASRGMVTDIDGIIGNGLRGADRDSALPSEQDTAGVTDNAPFSSQSGDPAGEGQLTMPESENPSDMQRSGADGSDGAGGNAVGWIIAVIIVLATVLVVLALLPRRDRDTEDRSR